MLQHRSEIPHATTENLVNFQRRLEALYNKTAGTVISKSMKQEENQKLKYKNRRRREKVYQDSLIEDRYMDLAPVPQQRVKRDSERHPSLW